MRQVYSPANSAEAHMLIHLLEQHGIRAHIQGEALSGDVGGLPAMALLQIQTADEDYEAARKILLDWEKRQRASEPPASETPKARLPILALGLMLLIGLAAGWILKERMTALPIDAAEVGFDDNGDGVPDGRLFFRVGATRAYKVEDDNNFDGVVDDRIRYDTRGTVLRQELDQDFDGFFETIVSFENGNVVLWEVDTDKNGVADIVFHHRLGLLQRAEYWDSGVGRIVRTEYFEDFRLIRSEHDLDRDGFAETVRTYDRFGEIVSTDTRTR